ncbi:uncharacterized protein LOC131023099 [Salvia miltiorrhiza]|uniref:uncharacterized protein LOC131023099 n=1 Tax=Salvia miltiorrhiza TaxID=226208 RepID=UPI0025AC495C|nr:uncharacterized protein LOC131023099 [Salvia miltiorrhiza]
MVSEMQRLFGIEINYRFALQARNIAIDMTYGDYDQSYQMLPSYFHLLRESNPQTSINAFENHLRSVIVVDGTHLKGKNKGILFVAVTKDGNEGVFLLAVGLGPIENDESWTWFFHRLRVYFDQSDDLLIVSDQHKSIKNVVELVYPNAAHGFCYYHIQNNLARYGQHVVALFKAAAYTYRSEEFERNFAALHIMKPAAHKQLLTVGELRWVRLKCSVRCTGFMTSNAAESLNSRLLWARCLPICSLLESFRTIVEKWFDERRATAAARSHELTEVVSSKVQVGVEQGHRLVVRGTTTHMFTVEEENTYFVVDLENQTCECREFELDEIPYRHACAAIRCAGLNVTDFVGRYFKQYPLLETYAVRIAPIPYPTPWNVPKGVSSYIVTPPIIKRQSSRPNMHF